MYWSPESANELVVVSRVGRRIKIQKRAFISWLICEKDYGGHVKFKPSENFLKACDLETA